MTLTDTVKQRLEQFDLDRRVSQLSTAAEKTVQEVVARAADLAQGNRDRVDSLLDKATSAIGDRTGGRYAGTLEKVRHQVVAGIDKVAARAERGPSDR